MNVKSVVRRLAKGEIHYLLGRFRSVRVSYSCLRHLHDRLSSTSIAGLASQSTLFADVSVELALREIRETGVYVGLGLPIEITEEIEAFAREEPLHPGNEPEGAEFFHHEIKRGYTADGRPIPLGGVREPTRCGAVQRVVNDPVLRGIIRSYLGYEPTRVLVLLTWSFASDFTEEERRKLKHHVIDYHYDVGGFNFAYANFYLLDTDRRSGAHTMMKRSHKRKPLRMLLGSAVASEDDVRRQFGKENEVTIEGPAGTGFVQDTSCFHRATAPTERDRLILAIRFS